MSDIEGVEMTIYTTEGRTISFDLSPMQLKTVIDILGIMPSGRNEISCYSDRSLKTIYEKTVGRFKERGTTNED